MIPHIEWNLLKESVFVFIYWFILIAYYKWYMTRVNIRQCYILIVAGVGLNLVYWWGSNLLYVKTGRFASLQNYAFDHWFIASMMIGFGIFSLMEKRTWHCSAVNFLAASAFGVYLIHTYWSIPAIWNRFASIRVYFLSSHAILFGLFMIIGIFLSCLLLDVLRQLLFKYTIDARRGGIFDKLWDWLSDVIFGKTKRLTGSSRFSDDSE